MMSWKKIYYFISFICFVLFSSCEVLKYTGNIYERKFDLPYPEITENGRIFCSIGNENKIFNLEMDKNENLIYVKASIRIDSAVSRTILGQYASDAELKGIIINSSEKEEAVESKIHMETEIYSRTQDGDLNFPCLIYNVNAKLDDDKFKIKYTDYVFDENLDFPILIINQDFKIYKCRCKEYILKDGSFYHRPEREDMFAPYQIFQLYREINEETKELLAEWNFSDYTIFKNSSISNKEIKKIIGCAILRIEWERLFMQNDFKEKCEHKLTYYTY